MKNPHKALEAIERLVGGGFGMDMEMLIYEAEKGKRKVEPQLLEAAKIITEIYCIAHAEGTCGGGHTIWQQKKFDILATPEL